MISQGCGDNHNNEICTIDKPTARDITQIMFILFFVLFFHFGLQLNENGQLASLDEAVCKICVPQRRG